MYFSFSFALELLQFNMQLTLLSKQILSPIPLPPTDFPSWFNAHAYLIYNNKEEMEARSSEKRLRDPGAKNRRIQMTLEQFVEALKKTTDVQFQQLNDSVDKRLLSRSAFIDTKQLYLQKLIVPPTSTIHFFGDLHGDISSLVICLAKLRAQGVINEKCEIQDINHHEQYIFFGGDFTDRGWFGAEVLQTICRLKIVNPTRVFIIRGNHEKVSINRDYGFIEELLLKFHLDDGQEQNILYWLNSFYSSLPVVIFLGVKNKNNTNYLLLCHGGLDFYDPTATFNQTTIRFGDAGLASTVLLFERVKFFSTLSSAVGNVTIYDRENPQKRGDIVDIFKILAAPDIHCGFMWNDFNAGREKHFPSLKEFYAFIATSELASRRGFIVGTVMSDAILNQMTLNSFGHKIIGVLRGHQHNETMPQALGENVKDGISDRNHGIYKIPLSGHHIFTKVSSVAYGPSPSFVTLSLANNPWVWNMNNYYLNNFWNSFSKAGYLDNLLKGRDWHRTEKFLTIWTNSFDGNSSVLIKQQKK